MPRVGDLHQERAVRHIGNGALHDGRAGAVRERSRDELQSLATKGRAAGQGRHLVELSERAQEILRKQGWFINGRIQRGEIADAVVTVVEKHDGPDKAASLDGLCTKTFGYSDESL